MVRYNLKVAQIAHKMSKLGRVMERRRILNERTRAEKPKRSAQHEIKSNWSELNPESGVRTTFINKARQWSTDLK